MTNQKTSYFILWTVAGMLCAGSAIRYLLSGQTYINSDLRNFLVVAQLIFGALTVAYGFRLYRQPITK